MEEKTIKLNIKRFEKMAGEIKRYGSERLMAFIRKSDFYRAPASTRFHLSCEGGLLQHSLNVYDALAGQMEIIPGDSPDSPEGTITYRACIAGGKVADFSRETLIVAALFHDLCKVHFYKTDYRNQKVYKPGGTKRDAGGAYDWERVPFYTIEDREPYGHGEKSVMMLSEFIYLTKEERYAIRWHMGMANENLDGVRNFNSAIEKYPLVFFLHNADQAASHFMESQEDNADRFKIEYADGPAPYDEECAAYEAESLERDSPFEEAPKL